MFFFYLFLVIIFLFVTVFYSFFDYICCVVFYLFFDYISCSCFLLTMASDSIEGIYDTLKQCALISKSAGGIGLNVHCIRSMGSYIAGVSLRIIIFQLLKQVRLRRVGLVASVYSFHAVGRRFASRSGHTKDHHKNDANCLSAWHACVREGVWQCSPTVLKGQVVFGTVLGDMHLKHLLGSIVRVGYCIPVLDFYLVLHGLWCQKSTIMDESLIITYQPGAGCSMACCEPSDSLNQI